MIRNAPFLIASLAAVGAAAGAAEIDPADLEFFESKIRPVLVERCYQCHGDDPRRIRGGLILLDAAGVRAGGDSGAVIVPGSPEDSLLIEALHYEGLTQMPPDGKLAAHVIADFEQWIRRGAPDPRTGEAQTVVAARTAETFDYGPGREHWAFRRIEDPALPEVENEAWVSHDLDRFILSRLEQRGLAPVAPADRRTLLRRASFDLIGLPPSEAEIEDFLADDAPGAFARVVDRLLASPHYGERWGRHWLDIARYADSNGLDENIAYPNAFRYRDYVVDSLNRDKPFDRFVQEQIAGDLMPADSDAQRFEQITATGFLMLGPKVLAEQDTDRMLIDIVDEQVNTLGRAFLALPVGCARCHDHKFDPIPTADYYAMAGILRSTETMSNAAGMRWLERPLAPEDELAEYEAAQKLVAEAQEKVDEVVREQNDVLRRPRRAALAEYLLAVEEVYPDWTDDEAEQERRSAKPPDRPDAESAEAPSAGSLAVGRVAAERGLEPAVLERWVRAFHRYREGPPVEGDAPSPSTVFVIWNAYAAASPDRYEQVTEDLRAIIASEKVLTAPLTRSLVRGPAPRTLEEVAWRYASLFATIEIAWEEHLMRLGLKDEEELRPGDFRLPREQEELRWLVYDGYFCILCLDQDEEEKLYPPDALERLAGLRAEVERLEAASPSAPPYAMAVDETATVDLPVHIRGSHLNLADEPEPRGFLKVTDHLVPPPPVADDASGRLRTGALDHPAGTPAHRARHRQPRLALALRPRHRRHAEQLRGDRQRSHPPRASRLAGAPLRRGRLVAQETAPRHHAVEHLPAVERLRRRQRRRRRGEPPPLAQQPTTPRSRADSRRPAAARRPPGSLASADAWRSTTRPGTSLAKAALSGRSTSTTRRGARSTCPWCARRSTRSSAASTSATPATRSAIARRRWCPARRC